MSVFSIEEYDKKYGKSKQDVFFQYLQSKFKTENIEEEHFRLVGCEELVEGLNYYIVYRKVTAKDTATNFLTELAKLYERLEREYGIKSTIFVNGSFIPIIKRETDIVINKLRDKLDKSIATDEQYQDIVESIEEFSATVDLKEVEQGIKNYKEKNNSQAPRQFRRLCSSVAILMVLEYGCKNITLLDVKLSDVDIEKKIIHWQGFELVMTEKLNTNMFMYIQARDFALKTFNTESNFLFVNPNGTNFIDKSSKPNYTNFFYFLHQKYDSVETEHFAKKRQLEFFEAGMDVITVSKISGFSNSTFLVLIEMLHNKEREQKKLSDFLIENSEHRVEILKDEFIKCPVCGRDVHAISDNLILFERAGESILRLACKKCGGQYDK